MRYRRRGLVVAAGLAIAGGCGGDLGHTATAMSGEVRLVTDRDGEVICDVIIGLESRKPVECSGCDFAFEVTSEVIQGEYDFGNCWDSIGYAYYAPFEDYGYPHYYSMNMVFYSEMSRFGYTFEDALFNNYSVDFYGDYYGPYAYMLAYDGATDYGEADLALGSPESTLTWTIDDAYEAEESLHLNDCGDSQVSPQTQAFEAAYTVGGLVSCSALGDTVDVWSFAADGGLTAITVDTDGGTTASSFGLLLNDASGCTRHVTDYNFPCSSGGGRCGSLRERLDPGAYELVVFREGDCLGGEYPYKLTIDQQSDPQLALIQDDAAARADRTYTVRVEGTARIEGITPEKD